MPVHNGLRIIERAVSSLRGQTLDDWELIAIDDGSTDGSFERLLQWSRQDDRIRALRTEQNRGPAAARNEGIRYARGEMITYLDCDDEYYPDYMETVSRFQSKGDVLVFGYDVFDDGNPEKPIQTWDPAPYKNILFAGNVAAPLGVAHRRALALEVGGFDEELWALEDWDLWRRMARTGAEFLFLPFRSGLYHVRKSSRSRSPRLTDKQRIAFQSRLVTGSSLYQGSRQADRGIKKVVLLTSLFPFLARCAAAGDFAGAAHLLSRSGFASQAFCPSKWDADSNGDFECALSDAGLPFQAQDTTLGPHAARMIYTRVGGIPVSIFRTHSAQHAEYRNGEPGALLDYFEKFLLTYRPDAMVALNPGPQPDLVFDLMFHVGKGIDIPTVLWLGDEVAVNLTVMQNVDYCVVSSEFLRRQYWEVIGLACQTLPRAFDWDQVHLPRREPQVVMVLARDRSGESLVAGKIVEKLNRSRPDIPVTLLGQDWKVRRPILGAPAKPASDPVSPETRLTPSQVYSAAKVLLVPSLGHALFDRSVAEAMINGIPVVVGERGALPEVVGSAGLVADIPACYQRDSTRVPNADDISPWVDAVIRLWDDSRFYDQISAECIARSQCWHPDRVTPIYADFFRNLRPQPGPPLVPKWSDAAARRLDLGGGRG